MPFVIKPPANLPVQKGLRRQLVELIDFPATVFDITGIDCEYWHFGRSLKPLFSEADVDHRDAVFTEGGRLRQEVQASERESLSSNTLLGLYSPRVNLQVAEADRLLHTKATMCRDLRFKYIRRAYELDEFYDLESDPGETNNLIVDPAYAFEVSRLKNRMLEWYVETCDVVPPKTDQRNFV